ncbi:hypothetical protein [Gordonia sp. NPDC003950]
MARKPQQRRPGYRPKVAGSQRPVDTVPEVTDGAQPDVDSAQDTVDSAPEVVDSAKDTVDSAQDSTDSAPEVVDSAHDTVDSAQPDVDSAQPDVDSAKDTVDSAQDSTDSAPVSATDKATVSLTKRDDDNAADKEGDDEASTSDAPATEPDATEPDATELDTTEPDTTVDTAKPTAKKRTVARVSTIKPQPESAGGKAGGKTGPGRKAKSQKRSREFSWYSTRLIAIVGAVAVVLGIVALVLGLHPGATIGPNRAFIDQAATTDLTGQAQTKICTINSARSKDFDKWVGEVRPMMTGEALSQFNTAVPAIKEQFGQQEVTNDCKVDAIGVSDMSGDDDGSTATLLVNFVVSGTANGAPTQSLISRYQVSMVKQGDQWLVEKFTDL